MLFILGSASMHPASGPLAVPSVCADDVRASLVIVEFYPCAVSNDEYLVLCNRAAEAVNLFNWTVTDGEGVIRFTGGALLPGESLSVSENATSYMSVYGEAPGMHLPGWSSGDGAAVSGVFRLADAGDAMNAPSPEAPRSAARTDHLAIAELQRAIEQGAGAFVFLIIIRVIGGVDGLFPCIQITQVLGRVAGDQVLPLIVVGGPVIINRDIVAGAL